MASANEGRRPQTGPQLLLRFEEGSDLRERLEVVAKANNRTVTKEIITRLERSLQSEGDPAARDAEASDRERVSALEAAMIAVQKDIRALRAEASLVAFDEETEERLAKVERVLKLRGI